MPLWATGLILVVGVSTLVFAIRCKEKNRLMITMAIIGTLIILAALAYVFLAFILLDSVSEQPLEFSSEVTAPPLTKSNRPEISENPVSTSSPMPSEYDLPVDEAPKFQPDILGLRNQRFEIMPTFATQNEVSKFVLWNFLNDRVEFEFYLKKEIAPDEGTGFGVLHDACTSAMTYYLFGAYDMIDMFTEERGDDGTVYAKIKLIYTNPELDAEARAEAMEFVLKNPVPNSGFKDFQSEKTYARKIHDFIAKKVTYSPKGYNPNDLLASNNYEALQEAYNVLGEEQDTVVCAGYARAFALIAQYAGINAVWVMGNETETESHSWNVIYPCDGSKPVLVDVTWDDADSNDVPGQEFVSRKYFYIPLDNEYEHFALAHVDRFLASVNER